MGFPDFIIIPEFPLNYDLFLEKVREKYNSQKHLIIVIAEVVTKGKTAPLVGWLVEGLLSITSSVPGMLKRTVKRVPTGRRSLVSKKSPPFDKLRE